LGYFLKTLPFGKGQFMAYAASCGVWWMGDGGWLLVLACQCRLIIWALGGIAWFRQSFYRFTAIALYVDGI